MSQRTDGPRRALIARGLPGRCAGAFLLMALPGVFAASAATPTTVRWVESAGGTADDTAFAIATDNTGNAYVAGYFNGFAGFGPGLLMSRGSQDIFVSKLSNAGQFLWTRQAGGTNLDEARSIALSPASDLYVTGSFRNTAAFGSTNLNSAGSSDMFLARMDQAGNFLWVIQAGGAEADEGRAVALDSAGNLLVAGNFSGTAVFGTSNVTSRGMTDLFIAKYDSNGQMLWLRVAGGSEAEEVRAIAVDATGAAHVTGRFRGWVDFESTNLVSTGSDDFFLAKYASTGALQWVRSGGGTNVDEGYGVAVDRQGNSYAVGLFNAVAGFGPTNLSSRGQADIFLAKHDPDGVLKWAVQAGGTRADEGHAITVDADGNSYLTGIFLGSATFGSTTLAAPFGNADVFLAKFDSAGNGVWATASGGSAYINGHGIATDGIGNAYAAGYFRSPSTFGGLALPNASSGRDMFAVRVDGPPRLRITRQGSDMALSWPGSAGDYRLDSRADFASGGKWSAVTNLPVTLGEERIVTNIPSTGAQFFRLVKP